MEIWNKLHVQYNLEKLNERSGSETVSVRLGGQFFFLIEKENHDPYFERLFSLFQIRCHVSRG